LVKEVVEDFKKESKEFEEGKEEMMGGEAEIIPINQYSSVGFSS